MKTELWKLYPEIKYMPIEAPIWMAPGTTVVNQHGQTGIVKGFRDMGPVGPGVVVYWNKAKKHMVSIIKKSSLKPFQAPVEKVSPPSLTFAGGTVDPDEVLVALRAQGRQLSRIVESLDKLHETMAKFLEKVNAIS